MRLELITTDQADQSTTSHATAMYKMIHNLLKFHWQRTLPRSDLTKHTGEVSQESPRYFSKLIGFIQLIFIY